MPEGEVVHYYNVITGRIACGAKVSPETARTVFVDCTTCAVCLEFARQSAEKEPEPGGQ